MDKTVSQITIDQHYVPRSYLKNFANVKGTGKKEKALVSFYQFQGELLKENIPTKSICYKSYFYGEDGRVEKEFSEREAKWAAVIKEIINANAYCLGTEQESLIKEFVIYQFSRTSAMHNFVKESAEDLITTHMADTFGIPENDMCIKSAIKKKVDAEIKPTLLIEFVMMLSMN